MWKHTFHEGSDRLKAPHVMTCSYFSKFNILFKDFLIIHLFLNKSTKSKIWPKFGWHLDLESNLVKILKITRIDQIKVYLL